MSEDFDTKIVKAGLSTDSVLIFNQHLHPVCIILCLNICNLSFQQN